MSPRLVVIPLAAILAAPAVAQPQNADAPPPAFQRAVACRAVADPEERLACYDREVAALAAAEAAREIRVVERQQIQRTRRSLFGLVLPDLNVFGGDDGDEGVSEINGTIRAVSQDAYGKYRFTLEDGARWRQIDSRELSAEPRVGQPIRIRRAAAGSFLANVNRQIAIRVRRDQ